MPTRTRPVRSSTLALANHTIGWICLALFGSAALCAHPARAQSGSAAQATIPTPAGLGEWKPMGNGGDMMRLVGDPGKPEWFAFRVRYPAGMKTDSAPHFHLGTEHVTILSGTLVIGFGDHVDPSKVTEYGPGSFLVIPAGTHHYEWFRGETVSHVEGFGPMTTVWVSRPDTAKATAPDHH